MLSVHWFWMQPNFETPYIIIKYCNILNIHNQKKWPTCSYSYWRKSKEKKTKQHDFISSKSDLLILTVRTNHSIQTRSRHDITGISTESYLVVLNYQCIQTLGKDLNKIRCSTTPGFLAILKCRITCCKESVFRPVTKRADTNLHQKPVYTVINYSEWKNNLYLREKTYNLLDYKTFLNGTNHKLLETTHQAWR